MKVTVTIPDGVYEKYKAMGGQADLMIAEQLQKHQGSNPRQRGLALTPDERQALEKLLGAHLESGANLINAIKTAITIKVGGVEIPLEAKVLEWIKQESSWVPDKTFEELLRTRVLQGVDLAIQGYTNVV